MILLLHSAIKRSDSCACEPTPRQVVAGRQLGRSAAFNPGLQPSPPLGSDNGGNYPNILECPGSTVRS
jgi:hypothetical protein